MNRMRVLAALLVGAAAPAFAWGPTTQESITLAGAHLIYQQRVAPLAALTGSIREGASVSQESLEEMHPLVIVDIVGAIQREMYLLQSMQAEGIDPYFGYRLGMLGKMIVQAMAPVQNAGANVRARYHADVDARIGRVNLVNAERNLVDPRAYFQYMMREAGRNDQTIVVDYKGGPGFNGVAGAALSGDASRAVDAVSDVLYTIFRQDVAFIDLSKSDMRDYLLAAVEYYLARDQIAQVDGVYARALSLGMMTPDFRKAFADRYYAVGDRERAVAEYRLILQEEPDRRDVMRRIAEYYAERGQDFLARGRLEEAREALGESVKSDVLHPTAQRDLLTVEEQIQDRGNRLSAQQKQLETAERLTLQSEDAAAQRNYAQAIQSLREAEGLYRQVTDEFPVEARAAERGLRNATLRLREYKVSLMDNAQSLSGTGFAAGARQIAEGETGTTKQALRQLVREDYTSAMEALKRDVAVNIATP